jgi:hypothetical protein
VPYKLKKSGSGYKVTSPGRSYSKHPMSKAKAKRQLAALHIHTKESASPRMSEVFYIKEAPIQNRPPPGSQPVKPTDYVTMGSKGQALQKGMQALQSAGDEMNAYKTPQGDIEAFPKDAAPGRGPMKADVTKGIWAPVTGSAKGTPFSSQSPTTTTTQ